MRVATRQGSCSSIRCQTSGRCHARATRPNSPGGPVPDSSLNHPPVTWLPRRQFLLPGPASSNALYSFSKRRARGSQSHSLTPSVTGLAASRRAQPAPLGRPGSRPTTALPATWFSTPLDASPQAGANVSDGPTPSSPGSNANAHARAPFLERPLRMPQQNTGPRLKAQTPGRMAVLNPPPNSVPMPVSASPTVPATAKLQAQPQLLLRRWLPLAPALHHQAQTVSHPLPLPAASPHRPVPIPTPPCSPQRRLPSTPAPGPATSTNSPRLPNARHLHLRVRRHPTELVRQARLPPTNAQQPPKGHPLVQRPVDHRATRCSGPGPPGPCSIRPPPPHSPTCPSL